MKYMLMKQDQDPYKEIAEKEFYSAKKVKKETSLPISDRSTDSNKIKIEIQNSPDKKVVK